MLEYLKELITPKINQAGNNQTGDNKGMAFEKRVQVATCALFLEVANSDDEFTNEEKKLIFNLMKKEFVLAEDELKELIHESNYKLKHSISLYEYTDIINKYYDENEKYKIVKNLWKLVFIDGKLDSHEEYFMRTISKNLHLSHSDFITAKSEAKRESS